MRRQERRNQIPMRGVDFDAVEPGLLHALGGISKLIDNPHEIIDGGGALLSPLSPGEPRHLHQLIHRDGTEIVLVGWQRDRRNQLLTILHRINTSGFTVMTHLHEHFRAVAMRRFSQPL